ncbi:Ribosomal-protein-S18p-alanine acetyltransferase [Leucobacter sp. 7(1)]|uniref:ribosomal protein S18-alanine N-acetyltransferase n=1 Tax=Leucobacter sp. 7(1) TaxID=1255613 RepID=UPI00097F0A9D|nr:ribosomal protein S18-alanine N-acetyltransferase [Leucobacter sp. 7(1)]SJN08710.1 Ribosomal-protein-S18p-alanine acetyltransferase [Leucobacter sp. 7(1)]
MSETPQASVATRIRPATSADLDALWQIESTVFADSAWSRVSLAEELAAEHRSYLVLETVPEDGTAPAVWGYGGVFVVGAVGDVQTIGLLSDARGAGNGRRLMEALIAAAATRGARELFLEVRADNPVAHALYVSLGFAEIGVRPRYYQPEGVDAIVMRAELKENR